MSASAGRVLLIHKGNYDSSATYNPMDEVLYEGSTYVCKATSTGNAPTNTTYWQMMAQKGENGSGSPTGGTTGQVLTKKSSTNYDADWEDTFGIEDAKDAHILKGKNLAPLTLKSGSKNSVGYTVSDGIISTSGTASGDTYITVCDYMDVKPYLDETLVISGCTGGSSDWSTYKLRCTVYDSNNSVIGFYDSYDGGAYIDLYTPGMDHADIQLFINEGQNMAGKTFSPMICTAIDWETSQTYKPYYVTLEEQIDDLKTSTLSKAQEYELIPGRNLAVFNPFVGTESSVSVSVSDASTGELTLNGSASGSAIICISDPIANPSGSEDGSLNLKAGTYVLSSPQYSALSASFYLAVVDKNGNKKASFQPQSASDDHVEFTLNSDTNGLFIAIYLSSGAYLSSQKLQVLIYTLEDWIASSTYEHYYIPVKDQVASKISGKKVAGTVSSTSVTFTDSALTSDSIIDGPYVAGYVMGIASVTPSTGSVTFTFTSADADGETAYIWIR